MEQAPIGTDTSGPGEAPSASVNNDVTERAALIEKALRGISETVLAAKGEEPPDLDKLLDHGLTLIYCGLMAVTEIAHAQTVMSNLAQRDINAEIEARAKDKADALTQQRMEAFGQRSFIGQKT